VVLSVEALKEGTIPDAFLQPGRTRQEHDIVYGYEIRTPKGRCTVAFRNSSNGYYSGSLHLLKGFTHYHTRQLTEDWSA